MNDKSLDSYLFASNAVYLEELQQKYLENPNFLDKEWRDYFSSLNVTNNIGKTGSTSWCNSKTKIIEESKPSENVNDIKKTSNTELDFNSSKLLEEKIISEFRKKGHKSASLDPLDLEKPLSLAELSLDFAGFNVDQNDEKIKNLFSKLEKVYCSKIAIEIDHLESLEEKEFFYQKFESEIEEISLEDRKIILQDLIEVEGFEQFLHVKFPGVKRFSVEGSESSILALESIIKKLSEHDVQEIVIGMAHRGRLGTLTKVMGKSYCSMFSEFKGKLAYPEELNIAGDVKYHLGASADRKFANNKMMHLSLTPNPSHLEAVNTVVMGKTRAKQDQNQDKERRKIVSILLHGDAAFAGQGIIAEGLSLSNLDGYRVGGTIHIIINNQIGFTANPQDSRKSRYPTEVAKMVNAPIFHVNGFDPESVVFLCKIIADYQQKFGRDIILNVIGYRKYGHNEMDEPLFTQPILYNRISQMSNIGDFYSNFLQEKNILKSEEIQRMKEEFNIFLQKQLEESEKYVPVKADWLEAKWKNFVDPRGKDVKELSTGIDLKILKEINEKICQIPQNFEANKKIMRQLEARKINLQENGKIDWAASELLAFGSLLSENINVRLSGQDSGRGTFSHRHSVLFDQKTGQRYLSLNNISNNQGKFEVIDSNLSEYGVLGFEYGYSITEPNNLTIWEAQFGDFSNGAQIIIDQYLVSGEAKWLRMSGLVLLLPHGYEGQGPEHSSARLERFLQLSAENNIQVVNCTTPASLFHVLRRQVKRNYRKPLIIMSPKSLLRHKLVLSDVSDFAPDKKFETVIGEKEQLEQVKKLIICSGKIYYDIYEERLNRNRKDLAIIRLEQYYPWPEEELKQEIKKYADSEIYWCQEEHRNMGAWGFLQERLAKILTEIFGENKKLGYLGRKESASPAAGYKKIHDIEQNQIMESIFK